MTDTVFHYKGKPITDLSRDELVDALTWAVQEIEYQRERVNRYLQIADTDLRHGVMALQCLAPRPISVTERLPGPEDCQFNPGGTIGLCWSWNPPDTSFSPGYWTFWPFEWIEDATHWLPAHALPLPEEVVR